jgi:2'-5' RNA ligase
MRENVRVYLYAALVPPREILDELWSAADYTPAPVAIEPPEPPRRRTLLRRRPEPAVAVEVAPPGPVLELAPVAHVQLTVAKFGNLSRDDADRLAASMTRAAAAWSSPRLQLSGYSTLESEEDPSIWADLVGDLDPLQTAIRGVHEVAKGLRLFVDRRVFQPRVRLGGVRPSATESDVGELLARLALFESDAWWQTALGLYTPVEHGTDLPSFKCYAEIPLGPHVVH